MGDIKFKKVGKYEFSLDVPIDSDLMLAIELAKEKRDKTLEELVVLIKNGLLREDKEKVLLRVDVILEQNESIKLMEDAMVAVRAYKIDQKNNE
jgi:hypothetical protein